MKIEQEADTLSGRWVVIVAICAIVVTAVGVLIAWQLERSARRPIQASPEFQAKRWGRAPSELSGVEMYQFPGGRRGSPVPRRSANADRGSETAYRWSDRERGIVRIPLARAKELYLSGQRRVTADTRTGQRRDAR